MSDLTRHIIANDVGVVYLDCEQAFNGLTKDEKLYAHYLSKASWFGGLIVYFQTSPESPGIYLLLFEIFSAESLESFKGTARACGLSEDDIQSVLVYTAAVFANNGNYKSFGDTKFIPNISKELFEKVVFNCAAYKLNKERITQVWSRVQGPMYSLAERLKELGLKPKGVTCYFSSNCDDDDAKFAQEFLNTKGISAYNTRLFKTLDISTDQDLYEVRLASAETDDASVPGYSKEIMGLHDFQSTKSSRCGKFRVAKGDYSILMNKINENLLKAKDYASSELEREMIGHYITSFATGSLPAHKDGSRRWIKNKSPIVETYIGFIEVYRDPSSNRGEFEGFVAIVNKERSKIFTNLVTRAEEFLPLLPWPSTYEKDVFLKPDFTYLDVLTFSGGSVPIGINIPNYDEIRQNEGFKNVTLGNVIASGLKKKKILFIAAEDMELFKTMFAKSLDVQVGLHELLGHGSGKLFQENENGELNFDKDSVKQIITGDNITSWYKPGETVESVFSSLYNPYEECKAECVGLYLCLSREVLSVFELSGDECDDVIYINWLEMVQRALLSLEFYSPDLCKWGQAHSQARFAILSVLIEAGENFVRIEKTTADDGKPDIVITLDRKKIETVGKAAIGDFLKKLQVYKSTADYDRAKVFFDRYSVVDNSDPHHFLSLREIVLARKIERRFICQPNTTIQGDDIQIVSYDDSTEGLIKSEIDRYPGADMAELLMELWDKDKKHFEYDD